MQELLKSAGLQVVLGGGNFVTASIVLQIQNGSPDALLPIFQVLVDRINQDLKVNGSGN